MPQAKQQSGHPAIGSGMELIDGMFIHLFFQNDTGNANRFFRRNPEVFPSQVMHEPPVVVPGQFGWQSLAADDNNPTGIGKFFQATGKNCMKSGSVADVVNVGEHKYGRCRNY
jgi:hypothetical protein